MNDKIINIFRCATIILKSCLVNAVEFDINLHLPPNLPSTFSTAPEQPPHVISTLNSCTFPCKNTQISMLMRNVWVRNWCYDIFTTCGCDILLSSLGFLNSSVYCVNYNWIELNLLQMARPVSSIDLLFLNTIILWCQHVSIAKHRAFCFSTTSFLSGRDMSRAHIQIRIPRACIAR